MKKFIVFSLCALFFTSCTMHREAKARRVNARSTHTWHGWSKHYCPQTYGYERGRKN
jgi:hypothetical protein